MTIRQSKDGAAIVDTEYYWKPMETCPRSAKVQLLSKHGVAVYGEVHERGLLHGKETFWVGWAPLPKKRKEESNDR